MIGLINIQWFDNPGAVLLAYGLQETIKKLQPNEEIVIIDYAAGGSKSADISLSKQLFYKVKNKAVNAIFYLNSDNRKFRYELKCRHEKYENFRSEYLNRTSRTTETNSDIFLKKFSACIVGSDVVWKPEIAEEEHSKIYFLQFAGKNTNKIAYAASIGTDNMSILEKLKPTYKNLISDFDFISMREATGAKYIENLTDKKVYNVLDPVFLLNAETYISLIKDIALPCKQKYIYLYMLTYNEDLVSLAIKIAETNNYKIIYDLHTKENVILKNKFKDNGIASVATGPLEFLSLINNASIVLCDSFHGTAFSIILHKEFYTFGNHNGGIDISTRMKELLEKFSLEDRYVNNSTFTIRPIDYAIVDKKIENYRKDSIDYLKMALSNSF
ncbi:MAG: polysaccharide pyruvyl transferase family protein [Eubacteriales bacterium]|nr:polysaccharide pyruvyl transferase family protein [Eubacteriales bacterium]